MKTVEDIFFAIAPAILSRKRMSPEGIVKFCRETHEKLIEEGNFAINKSVLNAREIILLKKLGIRTIGQLKREFAVDAPAKTPKDYKTLFELYNFLVSDYGRANEDA